ncbi:chemoreceptor glutamine deamidase CheD [Simiduia sp. 21SJ11W-1]|uniref:chemoreceptor glutamine deamidase CheD n=1 Tax=Simiduia sp. 21SJ11W-1 TaxID=2909669 RepID=UPI00209CF7C3|nr:chemoreceptor glutamine deamidase CheD [Simiduia sp. 21SJ11W-1]UTA47663.1 chemoreceptor glutamine deamidase CheD [Simiduia sp. 21SJ11W-1]
MRGLEAHHEQPLAGFEAINRYWDQRRNQVVAKILPGEFYVSLQDEMIATTLGSCVSACIWDDINHVGGMNHFMLPETEQQAHQVTWGNIPSQATRYGNHAMEHLINSILKAGGKRAHLKAKIFGGGKVLNQCVDVGSRNADFVVKYLHDENIPILAEDLYGDYARKVLFSPISGQAFLRKLYSFNNNTLAQREQRYGMKLKTERLEGQVELFND